MERSNLFLAFIICSIAIVGCKNKLSDGKGAPTASDTLFINVDETLEPVIKEQIAVYKASYPQKQIVARYTSEYQCFNDLLNDNKIKLTIVGRSLKSAQEQDFPGIDLSKLSWNMLASDAVAVVVNKESTDSSFTLQSLRDQLTGRVKSSRQFVFPGQSETGCISFIKDSVLNGDSFDSEIVGSLKTSKDVLEYVSQNINAVGFVGSSWIGDPENLNQVKLLQNIKLCYLQCDLCEGKPFVRPSIQSVASRRYPFVRPVCYISNEGYPGIAAEFISFLKNERGQLVFRRSSLVPVMNFDIRRVILNTQKSGS